MSTRSPDEAALAVMAPLVIRALSQAAGGSVGAVYADAKAKLREAILRDPLDANLSFILGATSLFYLAEQGHNPKVNTFFDALVYVTTCMSVGYADIFARTETGKLVGSIVMTVGPALSGMLLDPPKAKDESDPVQAAIVARLDDILGELRKQRLPASAS